MSDPLASTVETTTPTRRHPCPGCGGGLEFAPGTTALGCPYCGQQVEIPREPSAEVREQDLEAELARRGAHRPQRTVQAVRCPSCGATTDRPGTVAADACPFCGTSLTGAAPAATEADRPHAVLPFGITREQAGERFRAWLKSLWFAPNDLLRRQQAWEGLAGLYVPHFTFDAATLTRYHGERGDDYWESESYTVTINGKTERRTRQVRKTRWRPVSGTVRDRFDDVLVAAGTGLPAAKLAALEPWDLQALVPFAESYLAGYRAERPSITLAEGFGRGKEIMRTSIRRHVERDIGGDHQRVHGMDVGWYDLAYKEVLLPTWVSSYSYGGKVYRFLVNARTGEVQGERPWSALKITLLVVAILAAIATVVLLTHA